MNKIVLAFVCAALTSVAASAQSTLRVRGTITANDGQVLVVKSREGQDLQLRLIDSTTVAYPKALSLSDIKPGDYIGTAALPGADGRLVASEVHLFPESARGTAEGHFAWDSEPGASMTNATLTKSVKSINNQELTLEYKGGTQNVLVPEGTPLVTSVPGDRSLLQVGVYVLITAQRAVDGSLTAVRIQATKDGVRPPQ